MSPFTYYRPKTLGEAIAFLERGVPLAGGTTLTAQRGQIEAAIDLQELALDGLHVEEGTIHAGASLTLQALVEAGGDIPQALKTACRLEAGWNVRNRATLGGSVMSGDGRSPLLATLLALGAEAHLEPGDEIMSLGTLLEQRHAPAFRRLITELRFQQPLSLHYEQVSRAPADRPLVCVALAILPGEGSDGKLRVALGGFGARPVILPDIEHAHRQQAGLQAAAEAARTCFVGAEDAWASAEYRSHVAFVLVRRLLSKEVS
jgi:carbon-monoxide dehydrogenase medium subunit